MNLDLLQQLQQRVMKLEEGYIVLSRSISALDIDRQLFVKARDRIEPGIGSKLAYNSYGMIIGNSKLDQTDIPELPMSKIVGLETEFGTKANQSDISKLRKEVTEYFENTDTVDTGCKVNIDQHGRVVSVSPLLVEDIPIIPMDKVEGLSEVINQLQSIPVPDTQVEDHIVNPGTGCKVTYDSTGRVVSSTNLSVEDIPTEVLNRLALIEARLVDTVPIKPFNEIKSSINSKVDGNQPIQSGIYTKVVVDSKGLITNGDTLTTNDLPAIPIQSVSNLQELLTQILEDISSIKDSLNNHSK